METLKNLETIQRVMARENVSLFYISRPECGVCVALKPKVNALMEQEFPKIHRYYVDLNEVPEAAGQLSVLTIPAILVYTGGKELVREARYISVGDLENKIRRPYEMIFGE